MTNCVIFIFTNDNSTLLKELVEQIVNLKNEISVHIIDDSSQLGEVHLNRIIANKISNECYLGKNEFDLFYSIHTELSDNSSMSIGNEKWNLGTARNFAVDYAQSVGYEKVLFIDQDIKLINLDELKMGFEILNDENFVSFYLEGQSDNSILGHLELKYGIRNENEILLSGGFLYLTPRSLKNRFLNIYNEDWILQILESNKKRVLLPYRVKHEAFPPKKISFATVFFQELGELVVEGLFKDPTGLERELPFWSGVILERKLYIDNLRTISLTRKDEYISNILSSLLDEYDIISKQLEKHILKYNININ